MECECGQSGSFMSNKKKPEHRVDRMQLAVYFITEVRTVASGPFGETSRTGVQVAQLVTEQQLLLGLPARRIVLGFYPSTRGTTETMRQTFPAYALMENIDLLNSSRCRTEMEAFRNGVDNKILWSLRVLNNNGMPSPAFVNGNNFWLGDGPNCKFMSENHTLTFSKEVLKNNSIYRNPEEEFPPFKVHYFAARIRHNSTLQYHTEVTQDENLITLGFCLPASCTNHDIATMLEKVLNDRKLLIGELFSADFKLVEVTDLVNDYQWLLSAKIIFIVYGQSKDKKVPPLTIRIKQYIEMFIKRYIRLTPAYFFVILLAIFYFTWHDQVSIVLPRERLNVVCSKYWWTNILYINNFYHWDKICLSWSWYLPNDIQFFLFGNFLLLLSDTHYNTAISLGIVTILSSLGSLLYFSYTLDFEPTLDKIYKTLTDLYIRPWVRIVPYLVGMVTSYLLTKWNYKLHLSRKSLIVGWILSILCNCSIIFSTTNKNIPFSLSIIYSILSRAGWSLGIAWLIIACCTNHGGIVYKILSLDIFIPLSRLSYCAYLVNPFVILIICTLRNFPSYIDYYNVVSIIK
ncbi:Nose resistant to fluoxetine protein 6 [Melipona quadrifasciata]|uniref:Nose resistant to fluoxetine protein 6 n=1 Tax=Melipona quadrifasciata TaxID=166423 RepID=A0A0M9A9P8_9HYME|nr:Nose resistant to fluoxetine protein 6 [Melipona quadrifasciata]